MKKEKKLKIVLYVFLPSIKLDCWNVVQNSVYFPDTVNQFARGLSQKTSNCLIKKYYFKTANPYTLIYDSLNTT